MSTQKIQLAIRATAPEVWHALTDPAVTPAYYIGFAAHFDLTAGAPYSYRVGDAEMITGSVLEVVEASRLRTTFNGAWDPEVAALPESTVTVELGPTAMAHEGLTQLTLTHEGLPDTPVSANLEKGWVLILSGLKTLLETGSPLVPAPTH